VFEQDIAWVRLGQKVQVRFNAYPERIFEGEVSFIYPTLSVETRTVKIRVDLPNPEGALKPAMYGTVALAAGSRGRGLTVPDSAVIDSGARRVVLIERGEGRFEPRAVTTGARADGYVEIREGVSAGERVVVKANFLIDAESNLKAALGGFGHDHGGKPAGAPDAKAGLTHTGEGTVEAVDAATATVKLSHGPIASLQWPAMTMDFAVADKALLAGLKPGMKVRIGLREGAPGEYLLVAIAPAGAADTADAHKGH
jgi:Cu(I)/Ag(I) efflux system membrane fusion protein